MALFGGSSSSSASHVQLQDERGVGTDQAIVVPGLRAGSGGSQVYFSSDRTYTDQSYNVNQVTDLGAIKEAGQVSRDAVAVVGSANQAGLDAVALIAQSAIDAVDRGRAESLDGYEIVQANALEAVTASQKQADERSFDNLIKWGAFVAAAFLVTRVWKP